MEESENTCRDNMPERKNTHKEIMPNSEKEMSNRKNEVPDTMYEIREYVFRLCNR